MSEGGAPLRQEVLPARRAERSAEAHPHAGSMKLSECPASDHVSAYD